MVDRVCSRCGWPPEANAAINSRVGLVYEVGRLRKRLALCVSDDTSQLTLHLDHKEDRTVALADLPMLTAHTSADDPPAVRLHTFESLRRQKTIKTKTDPERVLALAEQWSRDVPAMRAVCDAAVTNGWADILPGLPLTPGEKAWRSAHHAASTDDVAGLVKQLSRLPADGYEDRVGLILPHLSELARSHQDQLSTILSGWSETLEGVTALRTRIDTSTADHRALSDASHFFGSRLPGDASHQWLTALAMLDEGKVGEPVRESCRIWAAHRAFSTLDDGQRLEDRHVASLPLPFLEQVIASGAITPETASTSLAGEQRSYALARLAPETLTVEDLMSVGHAAELARLAFIDRNDTWLGSLPDNDPSVAHYRALNRFREGAEFDPEYLRTEVREKLDLFARARTAITSGETNTLPDRLLDDPTLWPAMQQLALDGKLTVGLDQRMVFPEFAEWVDLHALVAMLWNGQYSEADELGAQLASTLAVEQLRDEALNLRAFALSQLGQHDEALTVLEDALAGEYTEALLVNTCLIAAQAEPGVAASYLARLIEEAPNQQLQVAALRQAINIWTGDEQLPEQTALSLRTVLENDALADDDYIDFVRLRSQADRSHFATQPPARPPTLTKAIAYDVYLARALALEGRSDPGTMSRVLISSMEHLPDAGWVRAELDRWVDFHFTALIDLDWGKAPVSAHEIDTFLEEGEQYLSRLVYYVGAPLAGINTAVIIADANRGGTLSDDAAAKFFYMPAERFLLGQDPFPDDAATSIRHNFYEVLALFVAILYDAVGAEMQQSDAVYNDLNRRRSWDSANAHELTRRMRAILDEQLTWLEPIDRAFYHLDKFDPPPGRDPKAVHEIGEMKRSLEGIRSEIIRLKSRI